MAKILAIDDEEDILALIANILRRDRHEVITRSEVTEIRPEAFQGYDLILLDVMMPHVDGFELCRKIRGYVSCPILFLTAKSDEEDVVNGLMHGGDDYIAKPFGVKELSARVNAHLRRETREKSLSRLTVSGVSFDFDLKEVWVGDQPVRLTPNEYKICELLVRRRERVFTREEIHEEIYGIDGEALFTTITEFIRSIRSKFKAYGVSPISTVWGVGYRWDND
ncbi:response regulator transcription factor [Paenibacillus ihbetae]|uniref:DNA-binding response regulator n=1 Tax=Paenibacillus ihbetae TaxID=1870820 RepID=A0ABX3JUU1_9BACL|nr:response regulator transcription factor [Paenibacillus ihbetae]OOC61432.1 DNA-binding response regulator [Paenibacillus ihbetae]